MVLVPAGANNHGAFSSFSFKAVPGLTWETRTNDSAFCVFSTAEQQASMWQMTRISSDITPSCKGQPQLAHTKARPVPVCKWHAQRILCDRLASVSSRQADNYHDMLQCYLIRQLFLAEAQKHWSILPNVYLKVESPIRVLSSAQMLKN